MNTEPENLSKSSITIFPDVKILETASLGRSFGSGPSLLVDAAITEPSDIAVDFESSFLGLLLEGFDFFGVRDWSLILVFLLIGGLRGGREA